MLALHKLIVQTIKQKFGWLWDHFGKSNIRLSRKHCSQSRRQLNERFIQLINVLSILEMKKRQSSWIIYIFGNLRHVLFFSLFFLQMSDVQKALAWFAAHSACNSTCVFQHLPVRHLTVATFTWKMKLFHTPFSSFYLWCLKCTYTGMRQQNQV